MTAIAPIVVVGSASRDLTRDDPRGWRLGGAVSYGGLTLARLGLPARVLVGVDALAAEAHELQALRDAGAAVRLVRLDRTPIFENVETPAGRIQGCIEPGDALSVEHLPDDWRTAGTWLLGPVADELPDGWAAIPPPGALVAFGWQGILRHLPRGGRVRRRAPAASPLLRRADIVGVSRHDVDPAVSIDSLRRFLAPAATLLVTEGDLGGWEFVLSGGEPAGPRRYPAIPATEVDPTGAGDVFLAAYLAARVHRRNPDGGRGRHGEVGKGGEGGGDDLRLAAAAASLAVEGPGLAGVPTLAAVRERIRAGAHLRGPIEG